jgi:signal peptidase II
VTAAGTSALGRRRHTELWIAGALVVADQVSKAVVRRQLELHESVTVIPGFLDLTRVHNTGAAFGLFNTAEFPFKSVVLILVATSALAGVALYAAMLPPAQWLARIGLAFILGGAAGNLIDRVWKGYVLDFADFYWRGWHFWAFNVADAAITVGVSLMILDLLGFGSRVSRTV